MRAGRGNTVIQRLTYPYRGMNLAAPLSRMPEGSATYILNMLPTAGRASQTDQGMLRRIGGKRPGLSRSRISQTSPLTGDNFVEGAYLWSPGGSAVKRLIVPVLTSGTSNGSILHGVYANGEASLAAISAYTSGFYLPTFASIGNRLAITSPNGNRVLLTETGSAPTAANWSPGGVFPSSGVIACARYLNRVVVGSQTDFGTPIAFSKIGDPTSFDASGTTYEFAYAGNVTGNAGQPGDRITGLFSLTDDYLAIGCESSIWVLYGDPRAGGRVRMESDVTGIAGPRAATFDETGALWFIGGHGLYRWSPNSSPKEVLRGRMAQHLEDVLRPQNANNRFYWQLTYDRRRRMIYAINSNTQLQDGTFYRLVLAYSIDDDAPMLLSFLGDAGSVQVLRPHVIEGLDDGTVLVGGWRGLNHFDDASHRSSDQHFDQNNSAVFSVDCQIRFPPFAPDDGQSEWCAHRLRAQAAKGCGPVSWYLLVARSPDEVQEQTYTTDAAASGTLFQADDGFQSPIGFRVSGGCHQLVLSQNSDSVDWRMDELSIAYERMGDRRYGL